MGLFRISDIRDLFNGTTRGDQEARAIHSSLLCVSPSPGCGTKSVDNRGGHLL